MRPIFIDNTTKKKMIQEFTDNLNSFKITSDSIEYKYKIEKPAENKEFAVLMFEPKAYIKMMTLVSHYNTEVAWHCTVERTTEKDVFKITDVIIYPQKVTNGTVDTDDDDYSNFMLNLDDDVATNIKMQCHSHVNFGVTPSGTDTNNQNQIIAATPSNSFYIFLIINKKNEYWATIYDMENNICYENKDIYIEIDLNDGTFASEFIDVTEEYVKTVKKANTVIKSNSGTKTESKSNVVVKETKNPVKTSFDNDDDDYLFPQGYKYYNGNYPYYPY